MHPAMPISPQYAQVRPFQQPPVRKPYSEPRLSSFALRVYFELHLLLQVVNSPVQVMCVVEIKGHVVDRSRRVLLRGRPCENDPQQD
ncbi:hypothetical protein E2C01_020586 [Portunus trituberculatus]|uniref:Uncharacterized protein n=1 Tax=Portunus trituberculatus TaxID=210409 RepID=A0A5B7E2Q0_PORTR|nr:hypothetical protein [Portunus trituberculatus]